jgi:hypothetical protein
MKPAWLIGLIVLVVFVGGLLWYVGKDATPATTTPDESSEATVKSYRSSEYDFLFSYSTDFAVNQSHRYQGLGPGTEIPGVSFTIPSAFATGTNLSLDTYISVEVAAGEGACTADRFITASSTAVSDAGVMYSTASVSDAGAGNLYEEWVYALVDSTPCTAVRYFVHSTQLANYPEGTVDIYDRVTLLSLFDTMRRSLILTR